MVFCTPNKPAVLYYDVDRDGVISIADVTDLIDLLLDGGILYYTGNPASIGDVTDLIDYLLTGNN